MARKVIVGAVLVVLGLLPTVGPAASAAALPPLCVRHGFPHIVVGYCP